MFSVATVFLLLASLIAAAGFAVVAQRRLRQLGMLAAIGATQKHLRLVLMANGAIVGAIAAVCGTIVGLALWLAVAPMLESAVDHRIDRLSLPWGLLATAVALAVLAATAAAWWPARTVARAPRHARALRATAEAEARPPRGDRGRGADRARHRSASRCPTARQAAAHRRRDRRDDPRHPAPGPAGDPHLLRCRRATLDRAAIGAARPRSLPGPFRSGARRGHPRARHRRDGRRRSPRPRRRRRRPCRRTCPTGRSASTWARRRFPATPRSRRWPSVERLAARVSQLAGALDRATVIAAPQGLPTGRGRVRRRRHQGASDDRPRETNRPKACGARNRSSTSRTPAVLKYLGIDPGRGRSGHGLPRRSQRPDRPARSSRRARGATRITPSPTSSGSRPTDASSATRGVTPTSRRSRRSSPSTVFAAAAGSRSRPAGSSSPAEATDERPDR